ncbi:lactoylglutathione lyase [Streptomyces sp. LamerLS-316]|uniref:VOC family protein n=1 Tax=unclassified Streptomyces TaxID=2593676 RepID=UPI000823E23C|nr:MULTISPECIES: VOC family protein [unclassified Streptomyces]MYQ36925.1 VOC family protein [Streptomyces sp. SID4921]SCK51873.1 lactoylglutathione lyase [Streptomyces sp. LamerLS-316]
MTEIHARSLHHVNFPTADLQATEEWYGKVFGLKRVIPVRTPPNGTMLLTRGNFDLHFRPVEKSEVQTGLIHFAIEIEDWDTFLKHLDTAGVEYIEEPYRGHDMSKTGSISDPDGHRVEFTWHPDRDW